MRAAASLEFAETLAGFADADDPKAALEWLAAVPAAAAEFFTKAAQLYEL
jgi:hypothetical protein